MVDSHHNNRLISPKMKPHFQISLGSWCTFLANIRTEFNVYAPIRKGEIIDYEIIDDHNIQSIVYNTPKPATPLKLFFLPVKENVVKKKRSKSKNLIIGVPSCDLHALNILDEFYLHTRFVDEFYKERRESTLLIGTDCHSIGDHCHCTTYGFKPYPENHHDISLSAIEDRIILDPASEKGKKFIEQIDDSLKIDETWEEDELTLHTKRKSLTRELEKRNRQIPDYQATKDLIKKSEDDIWFKYADTCVSCGACSTICPTCSCFLLVDRPGFEKVRQMDACQYPGFARIAAGEDPLKERTVRFRNRYMCKYVFKPNKFNSVACTGCGRCIETCIGGIDKNELFVELLEDQPLEH